MPFKTGVLAEGALPIAQEAIYTVPIGLAAAYVKQLLLYNSNAAAQTITLWLVTESGTPRPFRQLVLAQDQSAVVFEHGESVTLEESHQIQAQTTTAAAVSYTITGVEEF